MKNAASYARFSSDNQDFASITAQLRAIKDYAKKNDIIIAKEHEYTDEAKSAVTDDRPGFLKMIDDIATERIKVDFLLVHKLDRFARNRYDSAIYRHELKKQNVKLIAVDQPMDDSPEGIILTSLLEGMAEYYSANLSKEIKKGMRENVMGGLHRGGTPPLGFDTVKEGKKKKYVINEPEAEIVRLIFKLALTSSYHAITDHLNQSGYRSKRGQLFTWTSIHDILRNPKYIGNYVSGRYTGEKMELEGVLPAIIDRVIWEEVQEKMNSRKHPSYSKPKPGGNMFLLTGLLFCGECGAAYTGNTVGKMTPKGRYSFYNCTAHRKKTCDNKGIQKEILENFVLDKIEELYDSASVNQLIDRVIERYQADNIGVALDQERITNAVKEADKKISNLLGAIEGGFMEGSIAGPRLNELTREKKQLEIQLSMHHPSAIHLDREVVSKFIEENKQVLNNRSDILACKKLIGSYVEKITLEREEIKIDFKLSSQDDVKSKMVDLKVSLTQPRPPKKSDSWINRAVDYN